MLNLPDFFESFDRRGGFPVLPEVISEIVHEIDAERISMGDLAGLVQKDVSFAAQVLAHANSSMYMMPNRITNVTQALQVIGLRHLKALCLTIPLFTRFRHIMGLPELWRHSQVSALCTRIAAEKFKKTLQVDAEIAETVGLMHDIGKIFLFLESEEFVQSQLQVADDPQTLPDWKREREVMRFDHSFIGTRFGRKFNFPPVVLDALLYHHEPEKSQYQQELVCLCALGDQMATIIGAMHPDFRFVDPQILEVQKRLGLLPSHFEELLRECVRRSMDIALPEG